MLHTIKNSFLSVTVSEDGAELYSVLGSDGTEYIWQGDPAYWGNRAPNLFPYVARLAEGSYYLDGKKYHMDIHGIAPYRRFALVTKTESALTLDLSSDEETFKAYPRQFVFRIHYRLDKEVLRITFEVINRDEKPMYFGLGAHPGFNVPPVSGKRFEDYRLRFGEPCRCRRVGFTSECLVSGEDFPFPLEEDRFLRLEHGLFENDAVVLKDMSREVTIETEDDPRSITVSFPQMPYLGLWHQAGTDAPYLCIEPWCSLPSSQGGITVFEEKKDLLFLSPGETYRNDWSIRVNCP